MSLPLTSHYDRAAAIVCIALLVLAPPACSGPSPPEPPSDRSAPAEASQRSEAQAQANWCNSENKSGAPRELAYRIIARYPHRPDGFTQGLLYAGGLLYESTGLYGQSALQRYKPGDQQVETIARLADDRFAEGLAELEGVLYLLTWKSGEVLRFAPAKKSPPGAPQKTSTSAWRRLPSLAIEGEGWGLASDGELLWNSDGSAVLTQRRAKDMQIQRKVAVTISGRPVKRLNELEWVNGCIVANVWGSERLVVIDPQSGIVSHTLSLAAIAKRERATGGGVANGVALHKDAGHWFVTGKNWRHVYQIAPQIGQFETP
ncbi:MAG: glutaminyl-peptide cyclotransferase [Pseudomonadales bacterium]